jgi:hypothetical protein
MSASSSAADSPSSPQTVDGVLVLSLDPGAAESSSMANPGRLIHHASHQPGEKQEPRSVGWALPTTNSVTTIQTVSTANPVATADAELVGTAHPTLSEIPARPVRRGRPVALDEYPIHQAPLSMKHLVSGDRNAYDRCIFHVFDHAGRAVLILGLGVYPNAGVIESFAVNRGKENGPASKLHTGPSNRYFGPGQYDHSTDTNADSPNQYIDSSDSNSRSADSGSAQRDIDPGDSDYRSAYCGSTQCDTNPPDGNACAT